VAHRAAGFVFPRRADRRPIGRWLTADARAHARIESLGISSLLGTSP
jgi:hypothetical protein